MCFSTCLGVKLLEVVVQLDVPSFFRVTTIGLHHSTGVLSTGLMIPHPMS